jgi:hypothetical protein
MTHYSEEILGFEVPGILFIGIKTWTSFVEA